MKVFLGGTCNGSDWRDRLIPMLKIDYFNPVVPDWTPACQEEELRQRAECDFVLYVITAKMLGSYSIAEVVDDSNKRPEKTIFCVLKGPDFENKTGVTMYVFDEFVKKSLDAVGKMVVSNGAKYFNDLESVAEFLNQHATSTI
jgi:hypothetical protein